MASDKITAVSVARYRGDARALRAKGMKPGSTVTVFRVSDGEKTRYVEAYGKTPHERKQYAIEQFKRGGGSERHYMQRYGG